MHMQVPAATRWQPVRGAPAVQEAAEAPAAIASRQSARAATCRVMAGAHESARRSQSAGVSGSVWVWMSECPGGFERSKRLNADKTGEGWAFEGKAGSRD
jgi:hypothetical protein